MNSLEEVMLEVYRLDYAEFDVPSKHRFSRRHDKAIKEILYPNYSMMTDYRIEQSRVPPKKRALIAALVIVLAVIGIACGAAAVNVLKRRTDNSFENADCVMQWDTTWFEDGMFYEVANKAGEQVLCYYSKSSDRSVVMCGMPECTHIYKTSPDCGALADVNTHSRYGFNRIGDKLYYIESTMPTDGTIGALNFIESDIDGKNRRAVASIKDTYVPFVNDVKYIDGHVLVSYYQNFDLVKNEGTGEYEFTNLEKYRFYMQWIDISTGEIETLLYREEYEGIGRGTVRENILYYSFAYRDVPSTGEMHTLETAPPKRGGFYILDLSTGEEKFYEGFLPFTDSYDYFSLNHIMAADINSDKIYLFDPETETFNPIADYRTGGYTTDGEYAMFDEYYGSDVWTRYNFETGEFTQFPSCYNERPEIYLNGVHEVGDTVWLTVDPGDGSSLQHAYIDRDDFYNGKFDNFKMIKEVELK